MFQQERNRSIPRVACDIQTEVRPLFIKSFCPGRGNYRFQLENKLHVS